MPDYTTRLSPIGGLPIFGLTKRLANAGFTRFRAWLAACNARRRTRSNLRRVVPRRILVVCYGNIYRSPFVARVLEQRLGPATEVRSAGFHRVAERPSPVRHVEACRAYGVGLDAHRSAVLTAADIVWADLIVFMDRHNWATLRRSGARPEQLIWLGALTPGPVDIADPYQLTDEQASAVVARLYASSEALVRELKGSGRP